MYATARRAAEAAAAEMQRGVRRGARVLVAELMRGRGEFTGRGRLPRAPRLGDGRAPPPS